MVAGIVLSVGCQAAPPAGNTEIPGVRNLTKVDATFACAGATAPEAVPEIKREGYKSIVNFRTEGEEGAQLQAEAEAARQADIKYFHLPFRDANKEVADQFLSVVADKANQPVFIHCGSANRVGAMWLIKRVKLDGWDVEAAVKEAETIGLRTPALKEFALEYVKASS